MEIKQARNYLSGAIIAVCALGLASCSSGPPPVPIWPDHTLQESRVHQNAMLEEFATFVPSELVVDDHGGPVPQGSTHTCSGKSASGEPVDVSGTQLPGRYSLDVPLQHDLQFVLEGIESTYAAKPGWDVSSTGAGIERVIQLKAPDGYLYFTEYYQIEEDMLRFAASSFSPCLETPTDFDPFADY